MKKFSLILKNRYIRIIAALVYSILLAAIIIYFRFPYSKVVGWVTSVAEKRARLKVTYESLSRQFPNKVLIKNLGVFQQQSDDYTEAILIPNATVTLDILRVLINQVKVKLEGDLYSGNFDVEAKKYLLGNNAEKVLIKLNFKNINPAEHPRLNRPGFLLSQLTMSGNGELAVGKTINSMNGSLELFSRNGKIDLSRYIPFLAEPVNFSEIKIIADLSQGNVNFKDIVLEGDIVRGKAAGKLRLEQSNLRYSSIDLSGVVKLLNSREKQDGFEAGEEISSIHFSVTGTLAKPQASVSAQPAEPDVSLPK